MFKFIAKTQNPADLFIENKVNSKEFKTNFIYPQGEGTLNKEWWDMHTQSLTGSNFFVLRSQEVFHRISVGFY